jgi:hypothetical protein
MLMKSMYLFVLVCLFLATASGLQAAENPFGWDISYKKVFADNHVPANDTMLKYFVDASNHRGNSRDMFLPDEFFASTKIGNLQQAILIDYQVYWYFGYRSSLLLLNYGDTVQFRLYNSKSRKVEYYDLKPERYVVFADQLMQRTPSKPLSSYNFKTSEGFTFGGYIGVISTYSKSETRQYMITVEDMLSQDRQPGEIGKLTQKIVRAGNLVEAPK